MNVVTLAPFFPVILGIHNAEEYLRYDDFVHVHRGRVAARLLARPVIRNAGVLLTLAAAVLCVLTWLRGSALLIDAFLVAMFALTLNALGYVVMTIRQRAMTPGTASAVGLVLPYSLWVITVFRASTGVPWTSLLGMAGLGLLLIPASVAVFLLLGYSAMLLEQRFRGTPDV